jgi:hypothetical protein
MWSCEYNFCIKTGFSRSSRKLPVARFIAELWRSNY